MSARLRALLMKGWRWFIVGCFLGLALYEVFPPGPHDGNRYLGRHAVGAPGSLRGLPDFTLLLDDVGPAVVNVTTRALPREASAGTVERHFDVFRGLSQDASERGPVVAIGSGFIMRADGYILTNAHVVDGAEEIYVKLSGRSGELRARVVGTDAATDIALLKIDARRLPVVRCGSSKSLKVGDWVAAIGSPFGFDSTITAGIVSAKERRLPQATQAFLQSDVAINPGSSGGPLVNLRGEVVGINSKIYTRTGGYMGVSFAIPIETALAVGHALRTQPPSNPGYPR